MYFSLNKNENVYANSAAAPPDGDFRDAVPITITERDHNVTTKRDSVNAVIAASDDTQKAVVQPLSVIPYTSKSFVCDILFYTSIVLHTHCLYFTHPLSVIPIYISPLYLLNNKSKMKEYIVMIPHM